MNEPFPLFFVNASDVLGRYSEVDKNASLISERYPVAQFPTILDMCSGVGHYSYAFATHGYCVTGVELSEDQVAYARTNNAHTNVEYLVGSMEESVGSSPFSLLTNTYSSFGYMVSLEKDQEVLCNWFNLLSIGGALVMELTDFERVKHVFAYPCAHKERVTNSVREELWMDWGNQILTVRYSQNDKVYKSQTRVYAKSQLISMLRDAGFTDIHTYGDFAQGLKTPEKRLIIECRK
ncbi:class I SAM-dependent methyltransferase [Billgrantia endophytica]|uniref:Methyltransferase domain-containing protein n=1 Tax=Billgrantia endophytica TaxID=2033802 RepID=A0A2N7UE64_9GAMM|nr:class I SAM-dependent methyltransferase [Halomonas endophytica]PMR78717.1 hypothetical protein C1H69_00110 [Halomonas endophytica]